MQVPRLCFFHKFSVVAPDPFALSGVPKGRGRFEIAPGPQSEGEPKMQNLTIAAMTGQAKSSGPKMVKGPIKMPLK